MSNTGEDLGLTLSLGLDEDVAAELEDFALLTRLAIIDEADDMIKNVLKGHLNHFAVFAEVVQFLLDRQNLSQLRVIVGKLSENQICFNRSEEHEFVHLIEALIAVMPEHSKNVYWKDLRWTDINFRWAIRPHSYINFDSDVEVQTEEAKWLIQSFDDSVTPLSFVHDIVAYYDSLIGHDLAWPAVRIFTIVCAKAERIRDDKPYMRINELYWKLFNWIGPVSDANHGHAQSIDQRACRLWTQYSWLRYLESIDYLSLAPDLSESMQSDLSELLGLLPNSSPRGELAAFCSKIYRETHGFSEVSTTPDLNWSIITEEEHTRPTEEPRSIPPRGLEHSSQLSDNRSSVLPQEYHPSGLSYALASALALTSLLPDKLALNRSQTPNPAESLVTEQDLAKADAVAEEIDDNLNALRTSQRTLDPSYKLYKNNFFVSGRVSDLSQQKPARINLVQIFASTWHETEGSRGTKLSQDITIDIFGQKVHTSIRRWIVMTSKGSTSLCVPVTTYNGRGCDKAGLPRDQIEKHTAICMLGEEPTITLTEREKGMRKDTIYADPASKREKLDPKSRINFAKYYHVEHNIKVRDVGRVHPDDMHKLFSYFKQSVQDDLA